MVFSFKLTSVAALVLASVVALPPAAVGCGESLFRVGTGVSYREYQAPLPGNILMVTRTASEKLIAEWLSHTGHNVQAVNDPANMAAYLKRARVDVVLALYKDRNTVDTQEATAGSNAKFIPIADANTPEVDAATAQYRQSLTTAMTPRDLLIAIHRTLKGNSNTLSGS